MQRRYTQRTERHKQTVLLLLGLVAVIVGFVLAESFTGVIGAATVDTSPLTEPYIQVYDTIYTSVGEEVVQVYLTDIDKSFYIVLNKGTLVLLEEGVIHTPTWTVKTTSEVVTAFQYKSLTLDEALRTKAVRVSPSGGKDAVAIALGSIDIYALS